MHLRLDYHQIFVELDLHFVLNEANLKTKIQNMCVHFFSKDRNRQNSNQFMQMQIVIN